MPITLIPCHKKVEVLQYWAKHKYAVTVITDDYYTNISLSDPKKLTFFLRGQLDFHDEMCSTHSFAILSGRDNALVFRCIDVARLEMDTNKQLRTIILHI